MSSEMNPNPAPNEETATNTQQVTVEVPEDRVAEFHAFFARFLAGRGPGGRRGPRGRGRYGRHGRHGYGRHGHGHGHGCGRGRHEAPEGETTEQPQSTDIAEV